MLVVNIPLFAISKPVLAYGVSQRIGLFPKLFNCKEIISLELILLHFVCFVSH